MEAEVTIPLGYREISCDDTKNELAPLFNRFISINTWLGEIGPGFFELDIAGMGTLHRTPAFNETYIGKLGRSFQRPNGQGFVVFVVFNEAQGQLIIRIFD